MNHDIVFWIVAIIVSLLVGISKAGFASGIGIVATPMLALIMPVADSAALLLPVLIFVDILNIAHYRHDFDGGNLKVLLPGAIAGIVLGGIFFHQFIDNERVLKVGLGVLGLLFLAYEMVRIKILGFIESYTLPGWAGYGLGTISGFTSTLAHAGMPPTAIYMIPQQLSPKVYVGTAAYLFFAINTLKLIPYGWLGLLHVGNLETALLMLPATYTGMQMGYWLNGRLSRTVFMRIIYTILLLTSIQILLNRNLLSLLI